MCFYDKLNLIQIKCHAYFPRSKVAVCNPTEFAKDYKTIQILNILYNSCSSTIFFPLKKILLGSLVVICNYGTIRLYGKMNFLMYILFPLASVAGMVFHIVFYPRVGRIFIDSARLTELRLKADRSRLNRILIQSCQAFGLQVGQYYTFQRKTTLAYFNILLLYTVNLLLLY